MQSHSNPSRKHQPSVRRVHTKYKTPLYAQNCHKPCQITFNNYGCPNEISFCHIMLLTSPPKLLPSLREFIFPRRVPSPKNFPPWNVFPHSFKIRLPTRKKKRKQFRSLHNYRFYFNKSQKQSFTIKKIPQIIIST